MAKSSTRLVFIHTGKYNTSGSKYTFYTSADIDKLSNATGFVITLTSDYNIYGTGTAGRYPDLINDIATHVSLFAAKSKPFYIGFPVINAPDGYSSSTRANDYTRLRQYVSDIRAKLNTISGAWSLFQGFYWTNERIFDTVSASALLNNEHVKLLNDLAYFLRSDPNSSIYKEFIWSPYLGYNQNYYTINNNLGMVANRTNIFNTIYLQAGYYFIPNVGLWNSVTKTGMPAENLQLAVDCANSNQVYNYNSNGVVTGRTIVGGSKTSSTKIALNIESEDGLKWNSATYTPYYQTECAAYGPIFNAGTCPFIAYAGSYNGIILAGLYKTVNQFYNNGTYSAPA